MLRPADKHHGANDWRDHHAKAYLTHNAAQASHVPGWRIAGQAAISLAKALTLAVSMANICAITLHIRETESASQAKSSKLPLGP